VCCLTEWSLWLSSIHPTPVGINKRKSMGCFVLSYWWFRFRCISYNSLYDDHVFDKYYRKRYHPVDGRLIQYADDYDICDCLQPMCPGCHYPCKSCGDNRCGKECRYVRTLRYHAVIYAKIMVFDTRFWK